MTTEKGMLWLLFIPSWGVGGALLVGYVRVAGWPPSPPKSVIDLLFLLLGIVLLLVPFATRIKLGSVLEIERDLKSTRADLESVKADSQAFKADTRQLLGLMANVQASSAASTIVNLGPGVVSVGTAPGIALAEQVKSTGVPSPPSGVSRTGDQVPSSRRTAVEYKILNTLWSSQVAVYPSLEVLFTFRLNAAMPEFIAFKQAGSRLLDEGLITESDQGQFMLTSRGLRYCAENYENFPADMWGDPVKPDPKNVADVKRRLGLDS